MREVRVTASADCPMVNLKVGSKDKSSLWLIDSGARESIIDDETFKESFPGVVLDPLPPEVRFRTADGSQ